MNYIYNIKVNLKNKLYNFYEWDSEITCINRIKIYLVDDTTYNDIINMNAKVDNTFLNELKTFDNMCLFTNDIDVVCIKFNNNGCIDLISKLDLEEELEVLNEISNKNKIDLNYKRIDASNNYSLNTKEQNEDIKIIKDYLKNNKDNIEVIDYIYYEIFHSSRASNKYEKIISKIDNDYLQIGDKLRNLIKLLV